MGPVQFIPWSSSSSNARFFYISFFLFVLSPHPIKVHSVSSSSSSHHASPTSKNPFTHELTGVSGFGARSQRKSIFPVIVTTTSTITGSDDYTDVTTTTTTAVPIKRIEFNRSKILPSSPDQSNIRLWVKKTKDPIDSLLIQVRDDDDYDNDKKPSILRLSVNENTGDWIVEQQKDMKSKLDDNDDDDDWIPIEGIYGMYRVPSGIIWVLISKTEKIYDAPPILSIGNTTTTTTMNSWWKIRRVVNLELVHLGRNNLLLRASHLKEEIRQLKLLRQALKYHDFYFVEDNNSGNIISGSDSTGLPHVHDMTKKLQISLDTSTDISDDNKTESSTTKQWWDKDSTTRPDPRFFWNQVAIQPLLDKLNTSNPDTIDAIATLLKNFIPLTSAFVGIKTNLTVGGDDDDNDVGKIKYDQILISRRSKYRAGTRFTRRGADATGSVANFVETEQIALVYNNNNDTLRHIMSHVQTRGSIPLRWSSPADVKTYRPRVRIGMDPLAQARALRLHLLEQFAYYGSSSSSSSNGGSWGAYPRLVSAKPELVFVNLIDKHSDQGRLGRAFDAVLNAVMEVYAAGNQTENTTTLATESTDSSTTTVRGLLSRLLGYSTNTEQEVEPPTNTTDLEMGPSAEHIWYDFHAEVKGGRWHKLGTLLKDLELSLHDHGFFQADVVTQNVTQQRIHVQRRQIGAIRTNCMDCLDRTNVVQSMLGRYILFQQLLTAANAVAKEGNASIENWTELTETFENNQLTLPWADGEAAHRPLWADNADAISRLYAGTPALKRDFTRTGKRTKKGALDDGMNSLQRYYLNNFLDADRQEGMDLLVGYANFSNADFLDEEHDVDEGEGGSYSDDADKIVLLSIQEAARKTFFGDILDGLNPQDKDSVKKRLDEIGIRGGTRVGRRNLDLRWLPGDLQCHVINQVEDDVQEYTTTTPGRKRKMDERSDYCSTKALEAIDQRSASFFPWWAEFEDSIDIDQKTEEVKDGQISIGFVEGIDLPLPQHQQQVGPLPPVQLLGVVLLAIQAPTTLAGIVVALLMLTFSPDVK